jgi:hypothetical protein
MNTTTPTPTPKRFTHDATEAYSALDQLRTDLDALLASPGLNNKTQAKLLTLKHDAERLLANIPRGVLEVLAYLHATERMASTCLKATGQVEAGQGEDDAWAI